MDSPDIKTQINPQRGSIVSIRLRHFMTYNDCTLAKPAPNLNMILGPNGSGKSAIVCAIIVGLAGDVSLTNRASSPASLVQRGRDWASTRIELYNDRGKNYVVERKIIITGRSEAKLEHRSEWRLNERSCLKAEIVQLMAKLNIKVDNLCQFLPQDSVAQFVKMSPSDLLTNTLKAAGDNRLVEQHNKLIDYSDKIKVMERELNELQEACKHNEVNARRLETEVEKLRERETLVKKRSICSQKVHYVRYLDAERHVEDARRELDTMRKRLEEARTNADPYRKEAERCKIEEERLKQLVESLKKDNNKASHTLNQLKNSIEDRKVKCQHEFAQFKNLEDREKQREQQIRFKELELDSLECSLNEVRSVDYGREILDCEKRAEAAKALLLQTNSERQTLEDTMRHLIHDIDDARRHRERVLAIKEKKINIVAGKRPDSHRVIEWLAKNTDKFKKRVYLPMLCEINVKDPTNSSYIETIVSDNDLFAFVCESEEDLRKLTRIAREELKSKINVILMPEKSIEEFEFESASQSQQLNRMKPDAILKDYIEAPEPILRYLYGTYDIHRIPIFRAEKRQQEIKFLMDSYKKFFVSNRFYNVARSRYDNEQVTATDTIRDARILIHSLDVKALRDLDLKIAEYSTKKTELDNFRLKLNQDYDKYNKEWHELATRVKSLKSKNDEKVRIETRIKLCRQSITKLKNESIDLDAARAALQNSVATINHDMINDLTLMTTTSERYADTRRQLLLNTLMCRLAFRNYGIAVKRHKTAMNDADRLVECVREQKQEISTREKQADRLCQYAEEKIAGFNNKQLNKKTRQSFNTIEQETTDALEQLIEELKIRIRNISQDASNSIMSEFNRETEELREKQARIADLQRSVELKMTAMNEIKETWLPRLKDVLRVIDDHYQDFMQKLSYGGKVELDHDSTNPDDFRSYGVMIMVKYRDNEQLIPLSSTRQSGGERSVATMIYMLALQTKTTVPFRVVDEINQGMDKENERKVFELLVRTADESSSQYFLVSPKLLSGLNYGDKMQIHVVFNGKNMDYNWESLFQNGYTSNDTGIDSDDD